MTGLKIVLPSAFSDTSLPVLYDDPILTEGSLVLIDPAHPANPWAAGVPADGTTVPNLAYKEAARAIGSGTEATLAAKYEKGVNLTSGVGVLERSGKGGLHVIMSASATAGTGKGTGIRPALPIVDWIVAHPNDDYYLSLWFKMTRFGNNTEAAAGLSLSASPSLSSQDLAAIATGGNYPIGVNRIGNRLTRSVWQPSGDAAVTPPFADPIFASVAVSAYTGTPTLTGATAQAQMKLFGAGSLTPFIGSGAGFTSRLLWRAYLEDLTVSGRSYATVDALDYAEYQKQCLTVGGRYYNDTYTTPALA
jgi:hypothetical protein